MAGYGYRKKRHLRHLRHFGCFFLVEEVCKLLRMRGEGGAGNTRRT